MVDKHFTPIIAVNDSELMVAMPKFLTAATGMDALTHAVEAYVSTAATPITDASAIKAIELIVNNLETAVNDGENREARDAMQYGISLDERSFRAFTNNTPTLTSAVFLNNSAQILADLVYLDAGMHSHGAHGTYLPLLLLLSQCLAFGVYGEFYNHHGPSQHLNPT